MTEQTYIEQFLAKGGQITQVEADVSLGLRRTDYLPRRIGKGQVASEKLNTGDRKFDMYLNALPSELRKWVLATGQDVRKLYKEYRQMKKKGLLDTYMPAVKEWELGQ